LNFYLFIHSFTYINKPFVEMQLGEMQHFNNTPLGEMQSGEMQSGEMQLSRCVVIFSFNSCNFIIIIN